MDCIDVKWKHNFANEPIRLISELNAERYEIRKIELFRDGSVNFADSDREIGGTKLGTVPVPSLETINQQAEFEGTSISTGDFENLWNMYACKGI